MFSWYHSTRSCVCSEILSEGLLTLGDQRKERGDGFGYGDGDSVDPRAVYLGTGLKTYQQESEVVFQVVLSAEAWLEADEDFVNAGEVCQDEYEWIYEESGDLSEIGCLLSEEGRRIISELFLSGMSLDEFFDEVREAPEWVKSALCGSVRHIGSVDPSCLTVDERVV